MKVRRCSKQTFGETFNTESSSFGCRGPQKAPSKRHRWALSLNIMIGSQASRRGLATATPVWALYMGPATNHLAFFVTFQHVNNAALWVKT
ncbi:hypothetical protein RJZ90_002825 [Blastomyces dermatitidis]